MWWFLLFIYVVIWIVVSTLSLISFFEDDRNPSGDDTALYAFASLGMGLIWPITMWVALAYWASSGDTPHWAELLIKLYNLIRRQKG